MKPTFYAITGRRTNGETVVLNTQGQFSLRTTSARLFLSEADARHKVEEISESWKGLTLKVEYVGDGSGLWDLISDNSLIGQDGY